MKKNRTLLTVFMMVCIITVGYAQQNRGNTDKWMKSWTNFNPNKTVYPEYDEKLPNIIASSMYLRNDVTYYMSGDVYVINGATISIEEGTIIRCNHINPANLIITRGSKMVAMGTQTNPIVFTSNKPAKSRNSGDWGGIIIAGSGATNTSSGFNVIKGDFNPTYAGYGGTDINEETTILEHVRIEFSGNSSKRKIGSNGLSLYGLGASSIVKNIMVSYAAQNSFAIYGGKNELLNLISIKAKGNDFNVAEGYNGIIENVLAVRHPFIDNYKGSNAFNVDGYNKKTDQFNSETLTDITISDATIVSLADSSNYSHTNAAVSVSNQAFVYLHNTKISGFSDVAQFDNTFKSLIQLQKSFNMDNSFFNTHGSGIKTSSSGIDGTAKLLRFNRFTEEFADVNTLFNSPTKIESPNFKLKKSLNTYMVMQ